MPDSQPRSLVRPGLPRKLFVVNFQCDSRTLRSRVQCRYHYATMTTLPTAEDLIQRSERKTIMTAELAAISDFSLAEPGRQHRTLDD